MPYKYKLWLEVERVKIDKNGKEISENETGVVFGYEPSLLLSSKSEDDLILFREEVLSKYPDQL